jgi:hypothetical protein
VTSLEPRTLRQPGKHQKLSKNDYVSTPSIGGVNKKRAAVCAAKSADCKPFTDGCNRVGAARGKLWKRGAQSGRKIGVNAGIRLVENSPVVTALIVQIEQNRLRTGSLPMVMVISYMTARMVWRKKRKKTGELKKMFHVEHFLGALAGCADAAAGGGFWVGEVKLRKKVVRKYLDLKSWGEGHPPKYLILKVVRYQILDCKGLAGGHVVVVNIIPKKCSTWNNFLEHRKSGE